MNEIDTFEWFYLLFLDFFIVITGVTFLPILKETIGSGIIVSLYALSILFCSIYFIYKIFKLTGILEWKIELKNSPKRIKEVEKK